MSKKILLADDSLTIQKVISITLASEDYELEIVGDGNAAVAKAKTMLPDLILADVAMPGKNGYEVCEIIKKDPNLSKVPVLLLAGTFEPLNREEAARVKADDSIIKPFESTSFVEKVKSLLAKSDVVAKPVEVTELPEAKPDITGNVWGAGDFLGTPEAEHAEAAAEADSDMDFLGGGLFDEATKEADEETPKQVTPDQAFMDLDIGVESPKKSAPPQRPIAPPAPTQRPVAPPVPAPQQRPAAQAPVVDFDAIQSEPFGTQQEEDTTSYWTGDAAPTAPPAPPQRATPAPPPQRPVVPPPPPVPQRPVAPPPPAEAAPELLKVYQQKQAPAAAPMQEQVAPPAPRPVERVVERVAAAATERIADSASLMPAITNAFTREQIAELVRKVAREVIEEIAWEVVPELTEEIVSNEMLKFRESFLKAKKKA